MPNLQHIENLLIRYRGQTIDVKTISGGVYEGVITDVTNDYVTLKTRGTGEEDDYIIVLLHSIESILPRSSR
jgi:ferredoxin-fold anticodon binding domain-containing protein